MNSLLTMQPYFVFGTERFVQHKYFSEGISHLYSFTVKDEERHDYMIIPDGCVNLLFGYDENGMDAKLYGTVNRPQIFMPGKKEYFGIRLYQEEFRPMLECTSPEIMNGTADISAVSCLRDYEAELAEAGSFDERTRIFLHFIRKTIRSTEDHRDEMIKAVKARVIEMNGTETVNDIALYFSYSSRYLNLLFQEKLGLSVKEFCETVRLQHILFTMKDSGRKSLTDIAVNEGYYDQAHFTRSFGRYLGMSPAEYRKVMKDTDFVNKIVTVGCTAARQSG